VPARERERRRQEELPQLALLRQRPVPERLTDVTRPVAAPRAALLAVGSPWLSSRRQERRRPAVPARQAVLRCRLMQPAAMAARNSLRGRVPLRQSLSM